MKFKTFRIIAACLGLSVLCGVCGVVGSAMGLLGISGSESVDPPPVVTPIDGGSADTTPAAPTPTPRDDPPPVAAAPRTLPPAVAEDVRPKDRAIVAQAKAGISGKKLKDAFPHKPWKVSFYSDDGSGRVNRLKLDLDRDDRWDEKWTFMDGGAVKRQVSPIDDDATYSQEFMLEGMRWIPSAVQPKIAESAPPPPPRRPTPPPARTPDTRAPNPPLREQKGQPLRALDRQILQLAERGISGNKVKDAFKGQRWKANVYGEGGRVTRVKLDLDRDDNWDEKWTFDSPSDVKRQVSPRDDGSYPQEFRLRGGSWVSK